MLEDIAILTGGKVISEELGIKLESIKLEDLVVPNEVTIDKDNTTIVQGAGKKADIEGRISKFALRLKKPNPIMTRKNYRNVWRN